MKTEADRLELPTGELTVSVGSEPAEPKPSDPDAALRLAIKVAVDAGDLDRAGKLLDILKGTPKVVDLASRRERR